MQSNSSTNNNITAFTHTPKRKLAETSPEDMANQGVVGKMDVSVLMEMMQGSMATLLDEKLKKLPTKEDLDEVTTKVESFTTKMDEIVKENQLLKERVRILEENRNKEHDVIVRLEEKMKRKNIIIRGIDTGKSNYEAVDQVIKSKLKIKTSIEFENIRKLYENEGKMSVIVELNSERMVQEIFKHTGNLKDTGISIECDLGSERLKDKKVLLQLKKYILFISKSKAVSVRNDKMKIENNWFKYNKNKELVCGSQKAEDVLKSVYGDVIACLDLNYANIFNKLISKN